MQDQQERRKKDRSFLIEILRPAKLPLRFLAEFSKSADRGRNSLFSKFLCKFFHWKMTHR